MANNDNVSKFKTIVLDRKRTADADSGSDRKSTERITLSERVRQRRLQKEDRAEGAAGRRPFFSRGDAAAAGTQSGDGFVANVRFSEPILNVTSLTKEKAWLRDLPHNIAAGLLLLSFISIFCMIIDNPLLIAFAAPALVLTAGLSVLDSVDKSKVKYIACGVIAALLIAAAVIFRAKIGPGLALLTDYFYDMAEDAQAYIYNRFPGGDNASDMDSRLAMLWLSSLLGMLLAAVPPAFKRTAGILLSIVTVLALAYYGLEPSWLCAGAMVLALLLTIPRGNMLASLPVMLAVVLIFGAIALIDPGESYTISRMDENVRDRIALRTALLETELSETQDPFSESPQSASESESENSPLQGAGRSYVAIGIALLAVAGLGAAAYIFMRRYRKRRDEVRKGLDSKDPREAVIAMFPYSVRWLKAGGIEPREAPFSDMTEDVRRFYESAYAGRFSEMYKLWREAAYSDHDISEADRAAMDSFTKDTAMIVSDKWSTWRKLKMKYKHAL